MVVFLHREVDYGKNLTACRKAELLFAKLFPSADGTL